MDLSDIGGECDSDTKICDVENGDCVDNICTCYPDYMETDITTCTLGMKGYFLFELQFVTTNYYSCDWAIRALWLRFAMQRCDRKLALFQWRMCLPQWLRWNRWTMRSKEK